MQLKKNQSQRASQVTTLSRWYFWRRRGWLRYPLLVLLLAGTAVALRGGLWSRTPAKAAKRAAKRNLKTKAKPLPKVQMFLEHNERDINLKINKGKHVLPSPIIKREDRRVIVELQGVQVRPRKWTLSGSRVSSINVKVDRKGSRLIIAQDPKVKGTLKDAFSAEDVNGNLVLRVLNQSIGDKQAHPAPLPLQSTPTKIANASTAPIPAPKAKHPLGQKLNQQAHPSAPQPAKTPGPATAHVQPRAHHPNPTHPARNVVTSARPPIDAKPHLEQPPAKVRAEAPVQVVEHPVETTENKTGSAAPESSQQTIAKSALSMAASVLAFGLLALIPILWWKRKQTSPTADIKVQERLALSPKHSLVRVKLGANDLWLGLSEGNIQVITPANARPERAQMPSSIKAEATRTPAPVQEPFEALDPQALPEPMPAAAPPTLARRKLAAFKMRLREALAHPDSDLGMDLDQDAGRQADAIRKELARRQAHAQGPQDREFQQDAA